MRKKRKSKKPLWHPVYRFGDDVKRLIKRAKRDLKLAEKRIRGEFVKKKDKE